MNCKPGDLAVYVGVQAEFLGFITRVVGPAPWDPIYGHGWVVDPPMPDGCQGVPEWIADCALRPIRDSDGEDETLTWAGLPHQQEQPA